MREKRDVKCFFVVKRKSFFLKIIVKIFLSCVAATFLRLRIKLLIETVREKNVLFLQCPSKINRFFHGQFCCSNAHINLVIWFFHKKLRDTLLKRINNFVQEEEVFSHLRPSGPRWLEIEVRFSWSFLDSLCFSRTLVLEKKQCSFLEKLCAKTRSLRNVKLEGCLHSVKKASSFYKKIPTY